MIDVFLRLEMVTLKNYYIKTKTHIGNFIIFKLKLHWEVIFVS